MNCNKGYNDDTMSGGIGAFAVLPKDLRVWMFERLQHNSLWSLAMTSKTLHTFLHSVVMPHLIAALRERMPALSSAVSSELRVTQFSRELCQGCGGKIMTGLCSPPQHQPSGHMNFSRIGNVAIRMGREAEDEVWEHHPRIRREAEDVEVWEHHPRIVDAEPRCEPRAVPFSFSFAFLLDVRYCHGCVLLNVVV